MLVAATRGTAKRLNTEGAPANNRVEQVRLAHVLVFRWICCSIDHADLIAIDVEELLTSRSLWNLGAQTGDEVYLGEV